MAQDNGWFMHAVNAANDRTIAKSTPNVTVNTDKTGAGVTLTFGETFEVGGKTLTYAGTAKVGSVDGFFAKGEGSQFFFSKIDVGNKKVSFSTGDTPICFYPGTLVATPSGEIAVETLKIGDLVLTAEGKVAPVRWVGRQTVSTFLADPVRVLPIRISAGALGKSLPARDLLISPDHAILVMDVLIQAGALLNGTTIRREADVPSTFTYYHVELADHSLVLAEGVPAETFVDNVQRTAFDNWDEHQALYGSTAPITEMQRPRAKSQRQVPEVVRERIAACSATLTPTLFVDA